MKELDFDELDRAVNSLMGSSPKISQPDSVLEIKPSIPTQPASESPAPSINEPLREAIPSSVPFTDTPAPQLATPIQRKTGRFMDIVSSSSGSSVRPRVAPTAPPASREGLSITPRAEMPQIDNVSEKPDVVAKSQSFDMPDPMDMLNDIESEAPASSAPLNTNGNAVNESPFLVDAKVDKRPLNSPMSLEAVTRVDEPQSPVVMTENLDPTTRVEDGPIEQPVIPELDSDLVAIEAGESISEPLQAAPRTIESVEAEKEIAPVAPPPLGATSIAQQYTSQPSSGDQSHAAIYDASQYPEPVAHPAKKKSGWLWVLWVLVLLGIGAGGAVALYSFGIIP